MSQTKKQSLIETASNTTIGMIGSWIITMICLTFLTNPVAIATVCTVLCTAWSLGRGYCVRRYFNNLQQKQQSI